MIHETPFRLLPCLALFFFGAVEGRSATSVEQADEVTGAARLPGGKEADGIMGDFILRNDRVVAVVSNDAPLRRANMSTFYGEDGITPGCLYDLTLKGDDNDQITIFAPSGQQGGVSHVRIADAGDEGRVAVETVVNAAEGDGVYRRHDYLLEDGWQGVMIVTTLRNESGEKRNVKLGDKWTVFSSQGSFDKIRWADAVDPADKAGYATAGVAFEGLEVAGSEVELEPGEEFKFARFLAVGRSPAEAVGVVAAMRGETGQVDGRILGPDKKPVKSARVQFEKGNAKFLAYPGDHQGDFSVQLPPGEYILSAKDLGRPDIVEKITVTAGGQETVNFSMTPAAAIDFAVRDGKGKSVPCKAQFIGIEGTESPYLGPDNRAHGCKDQYHSETGDFRVQVPPGKYRVVVTRGNEFTHHAEEVEVERGKPVEVAAKLERFGSTTRTDSSASAHSAANASPAGPAPMISTFQRCGAGSRVTGASEGSRPVLRRRIDCHEGLMRLHPRGYRPATVTLRRSRCGRSPGQARRLAPTVPQHRGW